MGSLAPTRVTPVPLRAVVTTSELVQRPSRTPDLEAENQVLGNLAQTFDKSPESILQKLADAALALCSAHSAGISMLESDRDEPVIRWRAMAGILAPRLGSALPRAFSPCGTVLERNAIQLMSRPVRHFADIDALAPGIDELLLVPFRLNRVPVGVIWVVAHDDTRRFDAEDARLLTSLGKFAAGACKVLAAVQELEARIAERSATADLAIAAASQRDRFIAILGHELRGHLAPAKSAAELLKLETLDATTVRWASETIDRCVGDMTRLIDDLLGVARLRAGNIRLQRVRAAIAEIIERSLETVRPLVATRNHTLLVSAPPEPIFLEADVVWLCQALQNLVANAAAYTNSGGRIGINVQRDADEVVITVSDTGIGIAPAELDAIFELYVQADSPGRSGGGLGIGLYVARLVIEAHGGTIRAVSPGTGRGSQFIVRLPCAPPAQPGSQSPSRTPF